MSATFTATSLVANTDAGSGADDTVIDAPATIETGTATTTETGTHDRPPYAIDLAACATILAFASVGWQAWGSATAPTPVGIAMGLAMMASLVVGVLAVITRRRSPAGTLHRGAVLRQWWLWFIVEFALILAGNLVLGANGLADYMICWTHLVMALHFIPLGIVYRVRLLQVSAALGTVIAVIGTAALALGGIPAGPIVGGLGGLAMTGVAIAMIARARAITRAAGKI